MYPKAILVVLIKDVIVSYKLTVDKVSHRRELDIRKILEICDAATYDTMVIHSVRGIMNKIKFSSEGWFRWVYASPSRLSQALERALNEYERTVRKQEQYTKHIKKHEFNVRHDLTKIEPGSIFQPELPSVSEIHRQSYALENQATKIKMLMP